METMKPRVSGVETSDWYLAFTLVEGESWPGSQGAETTYMGITQMRIPIPKPAMNRATMNMPIFTDPPDRAAPMRVTSAPVWIVYLREKRSADQELKLAPRAEPAEQTPGDFDDQTIALPFGQGSRQTVDGPYQVCGP